MSSESSISRSLLAMFASTLALVAITAPACCSRGRVGRHGEGHGRFTGRQFLLEAMDAVARRDDHELVGARHQHGVIDVVLRHRFGRVIGFIDDRGRIGVGDVPRSASRSGRPGCAQPPAHWSRLRRRP